MNNLMLSVAVADGRVTSYGYQTKFYKKELDRNVDLVRDLRGVKRMLLNKDSSYEPAILTLTEWNDDDRADVQTKTYPDVDKMLDEYTTDEIRRIIDGKKSDEAEE